MEVQIVSLIDQERLELDKRLKEYSNSPTSNNFNTVNHSNGQKFYPRHEENRDDYFRNRVSFNCVLRSIIAAISSS